jgi:hypothetical protein
VGPRTGLDDVEKKKFLTLPGLELQPFGRPTRRHSLYRLSYPGSFVGFSNVVMKLEVVYDAWNFMATWATICF